MVCLSPEFRSKGSVLFVPLFSPPSPLDPVCSCVYLSPTLTSNPLASPEFPLCCPSLSIPLTPQLEHQSGKVIAVGQTRTYRMDPEMDGSKTLTLKLMETTGTLLTFPWWGEGSLRGILRLTFSLQHMTNTHIPAEQTVSLTYTSPIPRWLWEQWIELVTVMSCLTKH